VHSTRMNSSPNMSNVKPDIPNVIIQGNAENDVIFVDVIIQHTIYMLTMMFLFAEYVGYMLT